MDSSSMDTTIATDGLTADGIAWRVRVRPRLLRGVMQIVCVLSRIIDNSSSVLFDGDVMICARTLDMENDYYVRAHQRAIKEREELRIQIEKLLARDGKLEKLVDCLNELIPEAELAATPEHHQAG